MDYGRVVDRRAVVRTKPVKGGLWNRCREQSCGEHWSQSKVDYGTGARSRAVVDYVRGVEKLW